MAVRRADAALVASRFKVPREFVTVDVVTAGQSLPQGAPCVSHIFILRILYYRVVSIVKFRKKSGIAHDSTRNDSESARIDQAQALHNLRQPPPLLGMTWRTHRARDRGS